MNRRTRNATDGLSMRAGADRARCGLDCGTRRTTHDAGRSRRMALRDRASHRLDRWTRRTTDRAGSRRMALRDRTGGHVNRRTRNATDDLGMRAPADRAGCWLYRRAWRTTDRTATGWRWTAPHSVRLGRD